MPTTYNYNSKDKTGNTGLYVHSGDKLSINTSIIECWKDYWIPSSLEGFNFPLSFMFPARWKKEKYYCLCACVGQEEDYFIKIGNGIQNFRIEKSGTLYFFVNDYNTQWAYKNNRGLVEIKITIN